MSEPNTENPVPQPQSEAAQDSAKTGGFRKFLQNRLSTPRPEGAKPRPQPPIRREPKAPPRPQPPVEATEVGQPTPTPPPESAPRLAPRPVERPSAKPFQKYVPGRQGTLDDDVEQELQGLLAGMDATSLYTDSTEKSERKPAAGSSSSPVKKGVVLAIHGDDIFLDTGGRSQGAISLMQFPEGAPAIGSTVEVLIEGYDGANGLLKLTRPGAATAVVDWSSVQEGMVVEARVTGTNKGGLQVEVNGIRGFLPISHIELYRVEHLEPYLNQRLHCLVTEANAIEKNLVLSRRSVLEKDREAAREKMWETLAEGQIHKGTVRNIREFGAFVDLGGVDGLLHVSDMSWSKVDDPTKFLQLGQQVEVVVVRLDREKRKLSLGLKQLTASPWDSIEQNFPIGSTATGKVSRIADFGAFVELQPGIEGLVHISELARGRVWRVQDVVRVGDEVTVQVLQVDKGVKRISLSMRALIPEPKVETAPAAEAVAEPEPEAARKLPPLRKPLKGGLR